MFSFRQSRFAFERPSFQYFERLRAHLLVGGHLTLVDRGVLVGDQLINPDLEATVYREHRKRFAALIQRRRVIHFFQPRDPDRRDAKRARFAAGVNFTIRQIEAFQSPVCIADCFNLPVGSHIQRGESTAEAFADDLRRSRQ